MTIKQSDLNWLVGMIEGEGCFTINAVQRDGGLEFVPTFKLALTERDKETIEMMRRLLGFGRIEFKSNDIWKKRGMQNPQSQYVLVLTGFGSARRFIDLFDDKLFRTSKKKDFQLWKEAVKIMENFKHLTPEGFLRMCEIRDQMNVRKKRKNYKSKEILLEYIRKNQDFFSEKNILKRTRSSNSNRRIRNLGPLI